MFTITGAAVIITSMTLVILLPFVANELAKKGLFFARLESGNIKYINRGDTLRRIIADVRGKRLEGYKLVDLAPGEEQDKRWLERRFGLYWIGIPPFSSVLRFKMKRRKEHEITADRKPTEWIYDLPEVQTDSLRAVFPRPFLLTNAELGDRQTVNLLVVCKFEVVDAYIPVVQLKGDFFGNTASTLKAAVDDILKGQATMDIFLVADKGEEGILKGLKNPTGPFNQALERQVGLHLVGVSIPEWDPSDAEVRKAMNAKFIAEKEKEATIIAADAYSTKVGIQNEADALAMERLARARGARIKATLEGLERDGATPDAMVKAAADIIRAEAQVNLTTLVEGGGAHVVVPVGGGSK